MIFCIHFFLQLAESAKSQFSARDYSDHLALVRAYQGWKDAEREQAGYEYCWRNFLSLLTLKAIDSLRRQFLFLLKDTGLVDNSTGICNMWSDDEHLTQAVICAGLYPGISSVVVSSLFHQSIIINNTKALECLYLFFIFCFMLLSSFVFYLEVYHLMLNFSCRRCCVLKLHKLLAALNNLAKLVVTYYIGDWIL